MKNLMTQTVAKIGIVISIVLLCMGFFSNPPSKEISFYSFDGNGYKEYVGGDAYNIQIEASLRGGIIAGKEAARAVYFSAAGIVFVLSMLELARGNQVMAAKLETNAVKVKEEQKEEFVKEEKGDKEVVSE